MPDAKRSRKSSETPLSQVPAGERVPLFVRVPAELMREIEAFTAATHRNKQGAVEFLLSFALAQTQK